MADISKSGTPSISTAVPSPAQSLSGLVSNTKTFVPDAQKGEVRWMRSHTVYEMVGDTPWWLLTLAIAYASFRRSRSTTAKV